MIVDGAVYGWRVSGGSPGDDWEDLLNGRPPRHGTVTLLKEGCASPSGAVVQASWPYGDHVGPRDAAMLVRRCLASGWNPGGAKRTFELRGTVTLAEERPPCVEGPAAMGLVSDIMAQ